MKHTAARVRVVGTLVSGWAVLPFEAAADTAAVSHFEILNGAHRILLDFFNNISGHLLSETEDFYLLSDFHCNCNSCNYLG